MPENAYFKPLPDILYFVFKVLELPPRKNKLKCEQHQAFGPFGRSSLNLRRKVNYHMLSKSSVDFILS
jgi:hypothetical protein